LADGLLEAVPDAIEAAAPDGDRSGLTAGICHLCIPGVESEALLFLLERGDVYAAAGSSCSSGAMEPSHVLAAMGVPRDLAFGSLRLSLGWCSTAAEVDHALEVIPPAVARLRRFARPSAVVARPATPVAPVHATDPLESRGRSR
jgi:cysteine desulfurase